METIAEKLCRKVEDIQKCLFNGFLIYIIHSPPGMVNWNTSSSILFCRKFVSYLANEFVW